MRVFPKSHRKGVCRFQPELIQAETICEVEQGGILLMKPLLFHASKRTENEQRRRVIHLEFCELPLPDGLRWNECVKYI